MAGPLPTAADVIPLVQELITKLGVEAFKTNGRIQLYSGPRETIKMALRGFARNHKRAFDQADRTSATLIDDTNIGQQIGKYDGIGIYEYFAREYEAIYGPRSPQAFAEADKVMRFASREFIKAAFGHVATAVCGADTRNIFFTEELPELVKNHKIETVNNVPADLIREFYAIDPYEAFRLICLSELWEARRYAKTIKTPEALADYRERLQFFVRERQETAKTRSTAPSDELLHIKGNRKRVLAYRKLMDNMDAIIDADPVLPPAAMIAPRGVHAHMRPGMI